MNSLNEVGISVMEWPAYSPDISPLEYAWYDVGRTIRRRRGVADPRPTPTSSSGGVAEN